MLSAAGRGCTGMQTCEETEHSALNNIYTTKYKYNKKKSTQVYCTGREGSGVESVTYF